MASLASAFSFSISATMNPPPRIHNLLTSNAQRSPRRGLSTALRDISAAAKALVASAALQLGAHQRDSGDSLGINNSAGAVKLVRSSSRLFVGFCHLVHVVHLTAPYTSLRFQLVAVCCISGDYPCS